MIVDIISKSDEPAHVLFDPDHVTARHADAMFDAQASGDAIMYTSEGVDGLECRVFLEGDIPAELTRFASGRITNALLRVPSGKLALSGIVALEREEPAIQLTVPPGDYAVDAFEIWIPDDEEERRWRARLSDEDWQSYQQAMRGRRVTRNVTGCLAVTAMIIGIAADLIDGGRFTRSVWPIWSTLGVVTAVAMAIASIWLLGVREMPLRPALDRVDAARQNLQHEPMCVIGLRRVPD